MAGTFAQPAGHPEATNGFTVADGPAENDLRFTPLSESVWRVSDGRLPAHDPLRLLGFIQERGETCIVMQIGATFQWQQCDTFDLAVHHILATATTMARERMNGDLLWATS